MFNSARSAAIKHDRGGLSLCTKTLVHGAQTKRAKVSERGAVGLREKQALDSLIVVINRGRVCGLFVVRVGNETSARLYGSRPFMGNGKDRGSRLLEHFGIAS